MRDWTYSQQLAQLIASHDPQTFNHLRTLAREAQLDLRAALAEVVRFVLRRGNKQIVCWSCGQKRPDSIAPCPACRQPWSSEKEEET